MKRTNMISDEIIRKYPDLIRGNALLEQWKLGGKKGPRPEVPEFFRRAAQIFTQIVRRRDGAMDPDKIGATIIESADLAAKECCAVDTWQTAYGTFGPDARSKEDFLKPQRQFNKNFGL